MTKKRTWALVTAVMAVLYGTPSMLAWNNHGHMVVAAAAYQRLTPAVRARVDALVKRNPLYTRWRMHVASLPAADQPAAVFALSATWPDLIKQDHKHTNDGERPSGPKAAQNLGYGDLLEHRYWHFVDQPFSEDHTSLPAVPTPNAADRVTLFRATLASATASDALKSYDLVWLAHLVGDLHQPLHAATRVSHAFPNGDNGGNAVALCAAPCTDELHGFWDGALGTDESLPTVLNDAKALPTAPAADVAVLDPTRWAADGLALAQTKVYVDPPIGAGKGPFSTSTVPAYGTRAGQLATTQVALAAARLAAILNASLK